MVTRCILGSPSLVLNSKYHAYATNLFSLGIGTQPERSRCQKKKSSKTRTKSVSIYEVFNLQNIRTMYQLPYIETQYPANNFIALESQKKSIYALNKK